MWHDKDPSLLQGVDIASLVMVTFAHKRNILEEERKTIDNQSFEFVYMLSFWTISIKSILFNFPLKI